MHQPLRGNDKNQIPLYSIPVARAKPLPLQCQKPDLFYANKNLQATRPDWSWTRKFFEIAFAGFPTSSSPGQLWLLDGKTKNAQQVDCTAPNPIQSLSYPSWTKAGDEIILTDYATIDPAGKQRLLRTTTHLSGRLKPCPSPRGLVRSVEAAYEATTATIYSSRRSRAAVVVSTALKWWSKAEPA